MKSKKKNIKQKSFFFEDYAESEIIVNNVKTNQPKILLSRVNFLFYIYLSLSADKNFFSQNINQNFIKERGDILDRNGVILARNINIYDAAVRSKLVKDKKKLLINLKLIFPELNTNKIRENFSKNKFFYIKRSLTEDEYTKLWLLGNKGIEFPKRQYRIYPQKNLFSHILGQTDDSNTGISGIEKFFDKDLKSKELIDSSLVLSLDSNLQYLIREELKNAQLVFNNIGSAITHAKI